MGAMRWADGLRTRALAPFSHLPALTCPAFLTQTRANLPDRTLPRPPTLPRPSRHLKPINLLIYINFNASHETLSRL